MKLLLLITLILTGCTTVYKVDSKGICRAPDGKVVDINKINLYQFAQSDCKAVLESDNINCPSASYFYYRQYYGKLIYGGTCYGW